MIYRSTPNGLVEFKTHAEKMAALDALLDYWAEVDRYNDFDRDGCQSRNDAKRKE